MAEVPRMQEQFAAFRKIKQRCARRRGLRFCVDAGEGYDA
jgi:hypothetical protein